MWLIASPWRRPRARPPAGQPGAGRTVAARLASPVVGLVLGLALGLILAVAGPAAAADQLVELVLQDDLDAVLSVAARELPDPDVPQARKLAILRAQAVVHLLRHERDPAGGDLALARTAMQTMLRLDPDTDFVPGHRFPRGVHALFREVREETFAEAPRAAPPTRIAVAPFYVYNYSLTTTVDWSAFAAALPFMVGADLEAIAGLTLLSRDHLDVIAAELDLASEAGLVAAENRLRLGRLLSASAFVYGAVHVNGDEATLTIRWVPTETAATATAWQQTRRVRRGRDLLELYHEVVTERFLPRMLEDLGRYLDAERALDAQQERQRRDFAAAGEAYLDYIADVASAISAEDSGDPALAASHWQAASQHLESREAAGDRARMLELMVAYQTDREPDAGRDAHAD